jgi:hypothetical protein
MFVKMFSTKSVIGSFGAKPAAPFHVTEPAIWTISTLTVFPTEAMRHKIGPLATVCNASLRIDF